MLSDALYEAARPIWEAQLAHSFVRGIGDGTLDEERFKRWLRQDYRYLEEFSRVFAWAAAKADRLESMGWYARALDSTLNTEMHLHRRYAERFGISREELEREPMSPTTRAYTDFLLRTAADGDLIELLAALLPCAWGYSYIGRHLAAGERPADERYAEWIEQYASAEFAEAAAWLRRELDRLGDLLAPTRLARLTELFVLSSRYEWQFWEMCWQGEEWTPQVNLTEDHESRRVSQGLVNAVRPLAAAVIRNGDRLLVWEDHNPETGEVVCVPLAGGIEFGESGAAAIARELDEEIGATAARIDYLGTIEDIYDWNGRKRHELYLVYDVDVAERGIYAAAEVPVVEPDGTKYIARWRALDDLTGQARLVPDGLLELIAARESALMSRDANPALPNAEEHLDS
jgi:thiaminase (transcriptional activator TenA)